MRLANSMLLRALGVLLLTASVLKGWQLMNEPLANNSIWSSRWFHIMEVEFELAMGVWLVSGLFKKAAWLASLGIFSMFSIITLFKGITDYSSWGCFGSVHVNPWITLFAVDLPAVITLSIFRPGKVLSRKILIRLRKRRGAAQAIISHLMSPMPSLPHFAVTFLLGITILGITTPILAFNEPAVVTAKYEILEPETWIGKELPILQHIDIAETLKKGTWLILLYHYDCPDCGRTIPEYEQMARYLENNENFMQIALIAVPPYGQAPISGNSPCTLGELNEAKEWFVTTPAVALIKDGKVSQA